MPSPRVLVLHGPNLNLLGARDPLIYGTATQSDIVHSLRMAADEYGFPASIELVQSNHEGALIDALHAAPGAFDGVILNPSALTHTSIAIRDAVAAIDLPVVEVHLSNIHAREPYRARSFVAECAAATVSGAGVDSYVAGLVILMRRLARSADTQNQATEVDR